MKLRAELRGDSDIVATKNASREQLVLDVRVGDCELTFRVDPNNGHVIFSTPTHTTILGQINANDPTQFTHDGSRVPTITTNPPRRQP